MSEDGGDDSKTAARKAREARLAAALRANLRRRKAGGRPAPDPAPGTADEVAPDPPETAGSDGVEDRK
jgi:hypothetical protein